MLLLIVALRLASGTSKKKRRLHRGFGTAGYRESVFVAWKGTVPKVRRKTHMYISPGTSVADDILVDVPVLPAMARPQVDGVIKSEVLRGSSWSGQTDPGEPSEHENDNEPSSSGDSDEPEVARPLKRARRGRAILRTPTNPDAVPLFTHPIHPDVIKELVHSLEAKWVVIGTPESGCGVRGALSPAIRTPVVAICRNQAHAHQVVHLTKVFIAESLLRKGNEWTGPGLSSLWTEVGSDGETSDCSSSSSSDGKASKKSTGGKNDKKQEKKDVKNDKKDDKKDGKKDVKKDDKKDVKKDDKKSKGDKEEKDKKEKPTQKKEDSKKGDGKTSKSEKKDNKDKNDKTEKKEKKASTSGTQMAHPGVHPDVHPPTQLFRFNGLPAHPDVHPPTHPHTSALIAPHTRQVHTTHHTLSPPRSSKKANVLDTLLNMTGLGEQD